MQKEVVLGSCFKHNTFMTQQQTPTFLTDEHLFTWSKDHSRRVVVGIEEASSLGLWTRLRQFNMKSYKTSRVVTFQHARELRDNEHELLADVYVASNLDVLRYPHLRCVEVHILND